MHSWFAGHSTSPEHGVGAQVPSAMQLSPVTQGRSALQRGTQVSPPPHARQYPPRAAHSSGSQPAEMRVMQWCTEHASPGCMQKGSELVLGS
jgi:hypothetical protein